MDKTFYFYDLETSGIDARNQRIMQFAGQRTSLTLEPIGEPHDILVELTQDVLPEPDAILVTGITPQRTRQEGMTEKDFLEIFMDQIALPGTIFIGFNSIRFDDEFMRNTLYRNLYDPYEWQWRDGRSRWDLLDVVRMTRALRPEGINWPFGSDGKQANRLELITAINNLEHTHAHNALSDVVASIEVAKLIQSKQPKLFSYLLDMRDKNKVKELVGSGSPFVYTSGRYESEYEKTTIVVKLKDLDDGSGALVYDLRKNPTEWLESIKTNDEAQKRGPIKALKYNKCPAIAPLGVLDEESWERIGLTLSGVQEHLQLVKKLEDDLIEQAPVSEFPKKQDMFDIAISEVDQRMYDGFLGDKDKKICTRIHGMTVSELIEFVPDFDDPRLPELYFLYKARQMPKSLLAEDRQKWEDYIASKLLDGGESSKLAGFMKRLQELAQLEYLDADKRYILEELALYAQSIAPL